MDAEMDVDQWGHPPHGASAGPFIEEPGPGRTSRFFSAAELADKIIPERVWLVPELVPMETVTLLSGDGGTGKSLLGLQLAVSAVTGRSWIGRSVKEGAALVLSAEDDEAELHRRLAAITAAEGLVLADLQRLTVRSLAGEDALLAHEGPAGLNPSPLFHEVEVQIADERPGVVVLDTLADMFPANENDRAKVRQFVGILRGLAIRYQCAVLVLSHPSVAGMANGSGISGSTAWNGSVRSRLYLTRIMPDGYEVDPDARVLSTKKSNYGRIGGEIAMRWQDGLFVVEERETGLDQMAAGAKAERVFLKLLQAITEQGRRVNIAGGSNYAPNVFADHPDAEGCTKRAMKSAAERLLQSGKIRIAETGPQSKRRTHLEVV